MKFDDHDDEERERERERERTIIKTQQQQQQRKSPQKKKCLKFVRQLASRHINIERPNMKKPSWSVKAQNRRPHLWRRKKWMLPQDNLVEVGTFVLNKITGL